MHCVEAAAALSKLCRPVPYDALCCDCRELRCIVAKRRGCCHLALTRSREAGECWRARAVSARVHVNTRGIVAPAHQRERDVPRAGTGGAEKQGNSRMQTVVVILSVRAVLTAAARTHRRAVSSPGLMTLMPIRPTGRLRSARANS